MVSIIAKEVAKKVVENLRKGKKPVLGKIAREVGYAKSTSLHPNQITETKSYKEITEPILNRYLKEEERIMAAMEKKNLTKEQYRTLSNSIDTIRKQIQLLSGERTGNESVVVNVLNYGKGNNSSV
jgi:16S rRNA C967 or C1407 C5-methylase (RsmB/RsmF family)